MLKRFHASLATQDLLPEDAKLILAVSGGIDSVVLLDLLHRLQSQTGWDMVVAHLDHAQREDSFDDATFVSQLAEMYDLPFVMGVLPREPMTETAMRQARHNWLEDVRRESQAAAIVTAHHRGDRMETAVWHAIRGSDRIGLTSLRARRNYLVRPLIGFGRGDIITYAASRNLQWREDPSNADRRYTRNTIRHELIHHAPTVDAHYHNNFSSWLDHLETVNDRIDTKLDLLAQQIAAPVTGGWEIMRQPFLRLNPIVQPNLMAHLARGLTGGAGMTEKNLDSALKWFASASSGSYSEAIPGLLLLREYDTVKFVLRSATVASELPTATQQIHFDTPMRIGRFELTLGERGEEAARGELLVPQTYYVRTWQPGDRLKPVGMVGSKKLQDLFVDRKIPRSERLMWPIVVTSRNEIALVPQLARDRRFAPEGVDAPAHALHVKVV